MGWMIIGTGIGIPFRTGSTTSSDTVPAKALLNDDDTPIINDDDEYILTDDE